MKKKKLIAELNSFELENDEWRELDDLVFEACKIADPDIIRALLGILERNPEHDGYGVFWSIVHGLEAVEGYEKILVESVLSKPHELSITMLNRMRNAAIETIDGRPIQNILEELAQNRSFTREIRQKAADFIDYQRKKSKTNA